MSRFLFRSPLLLFCFFFFFLVFFTFSALFCNAQEQLMQMETELQDYDQHKLPDYISKLEKNPKDPGLWSSIGYVLPEGKTAKISLPGENNKKKEYTKLECYIEALKREANFGSDSRGHAAVYYNVGTAIPLNKKIDIGDGRSFGKLDLYREALRYFDGLSAAWYNLGATMSELGTSSTTVKGVKVTIPQSYANAIQTDPSRSSRDLWNNLGSSLLTGEKIKVDGVMYDRKHCFVEELELNPSSASAWHNLALSLDPENKGEKRLGGELIEVSGVKYNRRKCLLKSIKVTKTPNPNSFHNLAAAIHPTERISVPGSKKKMNSTMLYEKALQLSGGKLAPAWFGAGTLMCDDCWIEVNGERHGKLECYTKAIELSPKWADPWNNLATVVPKETGTVLVLGKRYTQKQLLIQSVNLAPEVWRGWKNLCDLVKDGPGEDGKVEVVEVDGGHYNKKECDARVQELSPAGNK